MSKTRFVSPSPHFTPFFPAASSRNLLSYLTTCCQGWRLASLTMISLYAVSGSFISGSDLTYAVWKSEKQVPHRDTSGTSFLAFFFEPVPVPPDFPSPLSLCTFLQSPSLGPSSRTGNQAKSTNEPYWINSTIFPGNGGRLSTRCTTFCTLSCFFPAPLPLILSNSFWSN